MATLDPNEIGDIVVSSQADIQAKGEEAMASADTFLDTLATTITELNDIPPINEDPAPIPEVEAIHVELNIPIHDVTTVPTATLSNAPLLIYPVIDLDNLPAFHETAPNVTIPNAPTVNLPGIPSEPEIEDISTPDTPIFVLPNVPTITDFAIPDAPAIILPLFSGTAPLDDLVPYTDTLVYEEQEYRSILKGYLDEKLKNDVLNGGTGLDPEVEQAIWDRGYERDSFLLEDEINKTIATWNSRGFSMPNGALTAQIRDIQNKFETIRADRNRDVLIKQAELAQANTIDAREKAIRFISMELDHFNKVADRSFQVARATVEFGIALFDVQVKKFNATLDKYRTEAQVYEIIIRGELAKLELFKTQLEGVKLQVDIQKQYIDVYNAQLQGVTTLVNIYKTEMEAASIRADIQKAKLQVFQAQVQAFEAEVRAKAVEFDLYRGRIDGEKAKVQVYSEQAGVYRTLVESYKVAADTKLAQANLKLEENRTKMDVYKTEVEVYRTRINSALDQARINQSNYQSLLEAYRIKLQVQEVDSRLALEQQRILINQSEDRLDRAMKIADAKVRNFLDQSKIKADMAIGGSSVHTNYAATIVNAMQSLVSLSGQGVQTATS